MACATARFGQRLGAPLLALALISVAGAPAAAAPLTERSNPSAEHPRRILLDIDPDVGDHYEIVDFPRVEPNAEVPLVIDGERFVQTVVQRLAGPPRRPVR
jgi:hypothetical protein